MVNIVLHAILCQPFGYQSVYICPYEMVLTNQGRMTSCAKISIQIPNTYIYPAPLSYFINSNFVFYQQPCENHV